MDVTVVLFQMIQLFLVMSLGYLLNKIHILDEDFNKKLTKLLLNVTMPALILSSVFNADASQSLSSVMMVFGLGLAIYIILPFVGFAIAKLLRAPKAQQGLYIFMTTFSNIGFMGIPVMRAIYGEQALFYTAIYNMIFNLFLYTIGASVMTYGTGKKNQINFKQFLTPGMIASVLALIVYITKFEAHSIIANTCAMVGDITSPIAMLIIGSTLAKIPLKEVFTELRVYPYTIIKQIIIPAISYYLLQMFVSDPLVLGVTLIVIAMPVANTAVLYATEYKTDEALAAKTVFITTLLSIITIPVIVALFLA